VKADYEGLVSLLEDTRKAMPHKTITMSYYPDGRQETLLARLNVPSLVDYMHSMSYDQNGEHHSSYAYGVQTLDQGIEANIPKHQITLGVPFYGRNSKTGDWTTYEDLVQKYAPLSPSSDKVKVDGGKRGGAYIAFNGIDTIRKKTKYALDRGAGGVMIWEVGQDCRTGAVTRGGTTHVVTCPDGERSSLLVAMADVINNHERSRTNVIAVDIGDDYDDGEL
jgi:GH18 family chitinase